MQLILLERVEKLGHIGDVVTVKDGFALLTVDFFYGHDPDEKYDEVLRQVNQVIADRSPTVTGMAEARSGWPNQNRSSSPRTRRPSSARAR